MSPEQADCRRSTSTRAPTSIRSASCSTSCSPVRARCRGDVASAEPRRRCRVREHEAPRPSARFARSRAARDRIAQRARPTRPTLARRLAAISTGSCSRRSRRIASVATVRRGASADDLRRHAENEPVIAGPPSTIYRVASSRGVIVWVSRRWHVLRRRDPVRLGMAWLARMLRTSVIAPAWKRECRDGDRHSPPGCSSSRTR